MNSEYIAFLSQSGSTNVPTAAVARNTLSESDPTYSRVPGAEGEYNLILTGAFPEHRTLIHVDPSKDGDPINGFAVTARRLNDNVIRIKTDGDNVLQNNLIRVEVLPE